MRTKNDAEIHPRHKKDVSSLLKDYCEHVESILIPTSNSVQFNYSLIKEISKIDWRNEIHCDIENEAKFTILASIKLLESECIHSFSAKLQIAHMVVVLCNVNSNADVGDAITNVLGVSRPLNVRTNALITSAYIEFGLTCQNEMKLHNNTDYVRKIWKIIHKIASSSDKELVYHLACLLLKCADANDIQSVRESIKYILFILTNLYADLNFETDLKYDLLVAGAFDLDMKRNLEDTDSRENVGVSNHVKTINPINRTSVFRLIFSELTWNSLCKYKLIKSFLKYVTFRNDVDMREIIDICDISRGIFYGLWNKSMAKIGGEIFDLILNNVDERYFEVVILPLIEKQILEIPDSAARINFLRLWTPIIFANETFGTMYLTRARNLFASATSENIKIGSLRLLISILRFHRKHVALTYVENSTDIFLKNFSHFLYICKDDHWMSGELFSCLCFSIKPSAMLTKLEIKALIIAFKTVIPLDGTVRQTMITSFLSLLSRIKCSLAKFINVNTRNMRKFKRLRNTKKFLNWLIAFSYSLVEPYNCYQRKIWGLKLINSLLKSMVGNIGATTFLKFCATLKNSSYLKLRDSTRLSSLWNCLLDSNDEIKKAALSNIDLAQMVSPNFPNFSRILLDTKILATDLLDKELFCMRTSGVFLYYAIARLEGSFKDVFEESLEKCDRYSASLLSANLIECIKCAPLYGWLSLLYYLISDPACASYFPTNKIKIISILELVARHHIDAFFTSDVNDASCAPSFEEMGMAVENIINTNTFSESPCENTLQFNPSYQLVVNYLWSNIKACVTLCEIIIQVHFDVLTERDFLEIADNVLLRILKLCRHKGVIEIAGNCLTLVTRTITMKGCYSEWLEKTVALILELISKPGETISRRSAGYSILIEALVAGDVRPHKPLLQRFIKELQIIALTEIDTTSHEYQELKQTQALHCLKGLVADSRNNRIMRQYLEELAIICLKFMNYNIWTVRNAASQLHGVVHKKIFGQSQHNNSDKVVSICSFEYLCTMRRSLYAKMMEILENASNSKFSVRPATVVTVLVSLKSTTLMTGPENIMDDVASKLMKCRALIKQLLNNQVYAVRKLAAEAYVALHNKSELLQLWENLKLDANLLLVDEKVRSSCENANNNRYNSFHGFSMALKNVELKIMDSETLIPLDAIIKNETNFGMILFDRINSFTKCGEIDMLEKLRVSSVFLHRWIYRNCGKIVLLRNLKISKYEVKRSSQKDCECNALIFQNVLIVCIRSGIFKDDYELLKECVQKRFDEINKKSSVELFYELLFFELDKCRSCVDNGALLICLEILTALTFYICQNHIRSNGRWKNNFLRTHQLQVNEISKNIFHLAHIRKICRVKCLESLCALYFLNFTTESINIKILQKVLILSASSSLSSLDQNGLSNILTFISRRLMKDFINFPKIELFFIWKILMTLLSSDFLEGRNVAVKNVLNLCNITKQMEHKEVILLTISLANVFEKSYGEKVSAFLWNRMLIPKFVFTTQILLEDDTFNPFQQEELEHGEVEVQTVSCLANSIIQSCYVNRKNKNRIIRYEKLYKKKIINLCDRFYSTNIIVGKELFLNLQKLIITVYIINLIIYGGSNIRYNRCIKRLRKKYNFVINKRKYLISG